MKVATKDIVNTVSQTEMDAGKLSARFDVEVSDGSKVNLPAAFESEVREDLVKLAVASSRANRRQAYGSRPHVGKRRPMAGMKHSVEWWGKGRGVSRILRRTGSRRGAQNPHTLGGRRAHGPKVEKDWSRKLNAKQRHAARNAALAATVSMETVAARGHRFDDTVNTCPSCWVPTRKSWTENQPSTTLKPSTTALQPARQLPSLTALASALTWSVPATVERSEQERRPCVGAFTRRPSPSFWWSRKNRAWLRLLATSLALTLLPPRTCVQKTWLPAATSVV